MIPNIKTFKYIFKDKSIILDVDPSVIDKMTKGLPINDGSRVIRGDLNNSDHFLLIDKQKRLIENYEDTKTFSKRGVITLP